MAGCTWTRLVATTRRSAGSSVPTRRPAAPLVPRPERPAAQGDAGEPDGLPDQSIEALRKDAEGPPRWWTPRRRSRCERSVPHGNVAAAHVMASKLGLRALLGPACRERDIAYALIISRAVRPESKLSTARWWAGGDTTLGTDLGVAGASTDEIYAAMDWLTARQREIEKQLAARHLCAGRHRDVRPVVLMGGGQSAASWPRSGTPATASAAASRSSTGCSPPGRTPGRGRGIRGEHLRPESFKTAIVAGARRLRHRVG